jgi:hypothetical protein
MSIATVQIVYNVDGMRKVFNYIEAMKNARFKKYLIGSPCHLIQTPC